MPMPGRAAEALLLTTEENPPFNFTDPATGRPAGFATEVVDLVMKRAGITYSVQVLPWNRAFQMALNDPGTCVYATNLTAERRPLFKWVTPLATGGWTLFSRSDWPGEIHTAADAKKHPVLVVRGGALERELRAQGFSLIPTSLQSLFRMLARGRAPLAALGTMDGPWRAKQTGVAIKPVLQLMSAEVALACSLHIPDETIARLSVSLAGLRAEGAVDRILAGYR